MLSSEEKKTKTPKNKSNLHQLWRDGYLQAVCDELYKAALMLGREPKLCHENVLSVNTYLWKILALLSLEKFSSCRDSWVRKATARWK